MSHAVPDDDFSHEVTYANTVKHWVLYTLDALEASREPEEDDDRDIPNPARDKGTYPNDIYQYAAGEDSIVFKSKREIQQTLSELARMGEPWEDESRPVNRRTDSTEWEEADVKFCYRLNEFGRNVVMDLGVPDKLPNRRDLDEEARSLGVKPAHQPGWWQDDYELYSDEWDIRNHDWNETEHPRVYFKDDGSEGLSEGRGYLKIGTELAEAFPDVTFVITVGPHRMYDLMYAIRDPWRKVVQIDVYSPMVMSRGKDEIQANFEALVKDLHKGLESVAEDE